jgi:pimeloyl-ACP methyl ester carboxylesterase
MGERLRVQHGGDGEPVLLLLHGLGASGDVWNGLHDVLSGRWPGRWVTPDLPGHGGSDPLAGYSFAVCGLAIKVVWTDEELARARVLSARLNPVYATRGEAADRHLRVAGLSGLVAPDAVGDAALVHGEDGWTLAFDPAAFSVGAPDMVGLLGASRAAVTLAAGERDHMCTEDQLRALVPDPVILPGLGHSAHVEAPDALWPLLDRLISAK